MNKISRTPRTSQALSNVRVGLRERRQARRDHRALTRELSTYNTRSDVHDLMASVDSQQGEGAEVVRRILTQNLAANRTRSLAS